MSFGVWLIIDGAAHPFTIERYFGLFLRICTPH